MRHWAFAEHAHALPLAQTKSKSLRTVDYHHSAPLPKRRAKLVLNRRQMGNSAREARTTAGKITTATTSSYFQQEASRDLVAVALLHNHKPNYCRACVRPAGVMNSDGPLLFSS